MMRLAAQIFAFALSTAVAVVGPASGQASALWGEASSATEGEVTRTPYGWADLCGRQSEECKVEVLDAVTAHISARTVQMLERINARVNGDIVPISNLAHWGTYLDHWDYPLDGKGDCKIYALWKRKLLHDLGFPRQSLLMTIVRDMAGNGHTVLTVVTDRGDFVLDNMVNDIRPWDETGYTFIKRQSQADPNVWVALTGPHTAPPLTDTELQDVERSLGRHQ